MAAKSQLIDRLDWEDVKTLTAVARLGTVRAAAKILSVHHSTVSRRIERLELAAQAGLFERRPEGLLLTTAGEALFAQATKFENGLLDAQTQIVGLDDALRGAVTLTVAEPLALDALFPRLPEFLEQYPNIDLQWRLTPDLLDVSRREADIAIRMDNNPPDTLVGKALFPYFQSIYCAPSYLRLLRQADRRSACCWLGWEPADNGHPAWTRPTELSDLPVRGTYPTIDAQIRAAELGLGVAMLPCLKGDAQRGLVRATDAKPLASRTIWILTHSDLRATARVRAVMRFAETALREAEPRLRGLAAAGETA